MPTMCETGKCALSTVASAVDACAQRATKHSSNLVNVKEILSDFDPALSEVRRCP